MEERSPSRRVVAGLLPEPRVPHGRGGRLVVPLDLPRGVPLMGVLRDVPLPPLVGLDSLRRCGLDLNLSEERNSDLANVSLRETSSWSFCWKLPAKRSSPKEGRASILSLASTDGQRMEEMTFSLLALTERIATLANWSKASLTSGPRSSKSWPASFLDT